VHNFYVEECLLADACFVSEKSGLNKIASKIMILVPSKISAFSLPTGALLTECILTWYACFELRARKG
jgi:hypothetical protein